MPDGEAPRCRVLVIGLDGATFDLLLPWMEEGRLPQLAAIWRRSSYGYLRSTIPPMTASAWPSFQTGKNPGKHGLFDFMQYEPGSYETTFINARSMREEPLWETLGQHGKQVVVINVPITYPPRPVNGFLISGMMTPGVNVEFTYPANLGQELLDEIGDYQILLPAGAVVYMGLRGFVDRMRHVTRKRAETAEFLMQRIDWDFFMLHFQSPDALQHALWSHLDPGHPAYPTAKEEDREYVQDYYRELDSLVGGVVRAAGENVTVILMSDHGFGPVRGRFHVNRWLAARGLLTVASSLPQRVLDSLEGVLQWDVALKLRRRLVSPRGKQDARLRRLTQQALIDWANTRAFALQGAVAIRLLINCRGREPLGIVEPGAEYERLRDEIAEQLLQIRAPKTGSPVVERVFKREEIYSGPALEMMPDLVALPVGGYQIATRLGGKQLFGPVPHYFTGNHRMEGILMMAGPDILPGQRIEGAEIVDLFPTILFLLDVPLPPDLDGKVLVEALSQDFLEAHPIRQEDEETAVPAREVEEATFSPEDAEQIRQRLEGLGYID